MTDEKPDDGGSYFPGEYDEGATMWVEFAKAALMAPDSFSPQRKAGESISSARRQAMWSGKYADCMVAEFRRRWPK